MAEPLEDKEILEQFEKDFALAKAGRKKTLDEGKQSRRFYDGHQWDKQDEDAVKASGRAPFVFH